MTKYLLLLFSLSFFSVESSFINTQKMFRVIKKTSLGVAMGLIPVCLFDNRFSLEIHERYTLAAPIFLFGLLYLGSSFIKNKEKKEFFKLNFGYAYFISTFFLMSCIIFEVESIKKLSIISIILPIIMISYVYSYLTDEEEIN